jgi:hypothetical protein
MAERKRKRSRRRLFWQQQAGHPWPHWHPCGWGPYGPHPLPPPWFTARPSLDEEIEALEHHIEVLEDELDDAREHLRDLKKSAKKGAPKE